MKSSFFSILRLSFSTFIKYIRVITIGVFVIQSIWNLYAFRYVIGEIENLDTEGRAEYDKIINEIHKSGKSLSDFPTLETPVQALQDIARVGITELWYDSFYIKWIASGRLLNFILIAFLIWIFLACVLSFGLSRSRCNAGSIFELSGKNILSKLKRRLWCNGFLFVETTHNGCVLRIINRVFFIIKIKKKPVVLEIKEIAQDEYTVKVLEGRWKKDATLLTHVCSYLEELLKATCHSQSK